MKEHELKVWPEWYREIMQAGKKIEARRNDRNFQVGDKVVLREWDPAYHDFTGKWVRFEIVYILSLADVPGLQDYPQLKDWVVLQLK